MLGLLFTTPQARKAKARRDPRNLEVPLSWFKRGRKTEPKKLVADPGLELGPCPQPPAHSFHHAVWPLQAYAEQVITAKTLEACSPGGMSFLRRPSQSATNWVACCLRLLEAGSQPQGISSAGSSEGCEQESAGCPSPRFWGFVGNFGHSLACRSTARSLLSPSHGMIPVRVGCLCISPSCKNTSHIGSRPTIKATF